MRLEDLVAGCDIFAMRQQNKPGALSAKKPRQFPTGVLSKSRLDQGQKLR
jgi:hypothetical protein